MYGAHLDRLDLEHEPHRDSRVCPAVLARRGLVDTEQHVVGVGRRGSVGSIPAGMAGLASPGINLAKYKGSSGAGKASGLHTGGRRSVADETMAGGAGTPSRAGNRSAGGKGSRVGGKSGGGKGRSVAQQEALAKSLVASISKGFQGQQRTV